jgi:copper oxidase (laccase) domain-containing protein
MEKLKLEYDFWNWIETKVDWDYFEYSFWNKEEALDKLELQELSKENNAKVIWINATAHSNKVIQVNALNIHNKTRLLKAWIDWVLVTNIDQIKDKIALILWVADCWAISMVSESWDKIALLHAWHKGTSQDIIWNLFEKLENLWEDLAKYSVYVAPMAWDNFEYEEELYFKNFQKLCDTYGLNSWDFFKPTTKWKWYLDLKNLIYNILTTKIPAENIVFSEIDTNSPDNSWPSYRLDKTTKRILVMLGKIKK